jgi:predicted DNA-binding transcriptional regulator YafY
MEDGSWLVKAEVPNTFLLIPFLASFGSWIQVLSPLSIQKGYVEFVHAERFGT